MDVEQGQDCDAESVQDRPNCNQEKEAVNRWTRELELSIVVPTFNEVDNVNELIKRIDGALEGIIWELVIVDDNSPDDTAEEVRRIARRDPRIRCIHRIARRGLSSACIEGVLATSASLVAVMDADLQHDERLLPQMLEVMKAGDSDLVVGSRYVAEGSLGEIADRRVTISKFATWLGRLALRADVTDPMSGFFMIRRQVFHGVVTQLSGIGFKILLDIFASSPTPLRFKELPYKFRPRLAGESKLDSQVAWEFGILLLDKFVGHIIPARFLAFCLVGGFGVVVHLFVVTVSFQVLELEFVMAQSVATLVAMSSNFILNNLLTYRDRRLRGWKLLRGWITFMMICSVGALANVGVAGYLYRADFFWIWSAIAGILVGTVWNYAVTSMYTWREGD
jgi:dolichol-phosphate mannosyltransferase